MAVFGEEVRRGVVSSTPTGRFDTAHKLIRAQQHQREEPLRDGGRWPVSAILQPDPASMLSESLERLMMEAIGFAGPHHWRTGRSGTAHLTIRALEWRRDGVLPDDPAVRRYAVAMRRAAAACGPLSFTVRGLTVTAGTVMALAAPIDGQADQLLERFGQELGSDGWLETSVGLTRDLWYFNLLHFAGPITDPDGLLEWVDARRERPIGSTKVDHCRLIRWDFDMVDGRYDLYPVTLATSQLDGHSH